MKERPIIFSGASVRAILEGRKTMTRRVVKRQDLPLVFFDRASAAYRWGFGCIEHSHCCPYGQPPGQWFRFRDKQPSPAAQYDVIWEDGDEPVSVWLDYCAETDGWIWAWHRGDDPEALGLDIRDPDGIQWRQPGDLLWVRETWKTEAVSGRNLQTKSPIHEAWVGYRADGRSASFRPEHPPATGNLTKDGRVAWRPSIFMPKWACRLWLRVVDVRVELVQEITAADAMAEGCECECSKPTLQCAGNVHAFRRLWDSLNAKRGYGWDVNPWVWVISFERLESKP